MNSLFPLFEPLRVGAMEVPNRLFMAPLTRCRAEAGHVPGALMAEYYAQRATAGLIGARPSTASRMPLTSASSDSPLST